jgi:hypothetical protein
VTALALGCDDRTTILSLEVSPDEHWAAVLTDRGEMGVLDLQGSGPLTIYSHHARRGLSWSPDGKRLAFVERCPLEPSAIWVLNLATGQRAPRPLMVGPSWKADPVWLSDQTVAFLSDRDADDSNLWLVGVRADGTPDRPFRLLDHPTDISRLWATPKGPALVYQAMDGGESALWGWWPGSQKPVRLIGGVVDEGFTTRQTVAFAPDGGALICLTQSDEGAAVEWYDLRRRERVDRLALKTPATDVLMLDDGRVAVSQGVRVLLWRPGASWYQSRVADARWWDAPLRALGRLGRQGMVVVADGAVVLTTDDAQALGRARLRVRFDEDVLYLAWGQAQRESYGRARRLLDALWEQASEGSRTRWLTALARAQLERTQGHWGRADRWLDKAAEEAAPGSGERETARLEGLALAFFDDRDRARTRWLLERMERPPNRRTAESSTELTGFIEDLLKASDVKPARAWQRIGGDVRQARYERAARELKQAFAQDAWTTPNLHGLGLLLDGALEPLEQAARRAPRALGPMMDQLAFQETLLSTMRAPSPLAPPAGDLRNLLLEQWVVRGDASLARQLVQGDLQTDPQRAPLPYVDLLRQYLTAEERPARVDRVVTDALLAPEVVERLTQLLRRPQDRLTVRLAQTRRALLDGDLSQAQNHLAEAWGESAALPSDALNITRIAAGQIDESGVSADNNAETGGAAAFRQAHDLFLMELYQAKISERRRRWSDALRAYQACLDLLNRAPADWDVAPFELVWSIGLIEEGSHDPEELDRFLRLRDQLGDPLLEPTREVNRLRIALANFQTLERAGMDSWLAPHVAFCQGLCWSLLRRTEPALVHLRRVETLRPSDALLQRALLEQAALRDGLEQSALAARLYERIARMDLPLAVRATALVAMIQSEKQAGGQVEPTRRLMELLPARRVSPAWRQWLWLQVGGDANAPDSKP